MTDDEQTKAKAAEKTKRWLDAINKAGKKQCDKWEKRGDEVVKIYRDERGEYDTKKQMNFLWSNVETLKPALYARLPKPQVSRRFKDSDPLGRQASMVLERALEYSVEAYDFDSVIKKAVEDYLLPGRGVVRVVYDAEFSKETKEFPLRVEEDVMYNEDGEAYEGNIEDRDGTLMGQREIESVDYEEVTCKYVYWKDFRHGPGRIWNEVPWVAYRSFYTQHEGVKRFGNIFLKVKLDQKPDTDDDKEMENRGAVWEVWDKTSGSVLWLSESIKDKPLKESPEPPLKLDGFFPSPEPLFAFTTNGSLIPIPEYSFYQDQADEINDLTARIGLLVEAVKVAGLYAGDQTEIADLLNSEHENKLIAVKDWAMFAEKGGLDGAISWYPVEQVIKVVVALYEARDKTKQELYEITGLSDIIRGASNANETATAQRIKGQFASIRLSDRQQKIQYFIRDLLRIKAEVIAEHFDPMTLQVMTGLPVPPEVINLLRNDDLRRFKIDIETDSTIQVDEQADKESRVEFLGMMSKFLVEVFPIGQQLPQITPLLGKMLMFSARGFRAGRELEESMEEFVDQMAKQAAQPQPPPPNPDLEKAKAELQMKGQEHQMDMQFKQQDHAMDMKHKQEDHKLEVIESIHKAGR